MPGLLKMGSRKGQSDVSHEGENSGNPMMVIFRASQYLSDTACQRAMVRITHDGPDKNPAATKELVDSFHPLTKDELKQLPEVDAYGFTWIKGALVRTHVVTKNGFARTNPPPDDYRCDSCHVKGWLQMHYQRSKVDGAVVPVWLCPTCKKLEPNERGIRF